MANDQSIIQFIQELVRIPSRGSTDSYEGIVARVEQWLEEHEIPTVRLIDSGGRAVGLRAEVRGRSLAPAYVANATLDTAGLGDELKWTAAPLGGELRDNWLYGRGAGDSKAAVAIFCHVAVELARLRDRLNGSFTLVFDADEHTGGFSGIKTYFRTVSEGVLPSGVFIGYPGNDRIMIGSRGFARAVVSVHGRAAHSGGTSHRGVNAVVRAAHLVARLSDLSLEGDADSDFPLSPQLTVTAIQGGEDFSVVPDLCRVNVDVRLTPGFDEYRAHSLVKAVVGELNTTESPLVIQWLEGWPAYRVPENHPIVRALQETAEQVFGRTIPTAISGPSNIGNYLSTRNVPAVCGFGVGYRNLHAVDECIDASTIGPVYQTYLQTLTRLLKAD